MSADEKTMRSNADSVEQLRTQAARVKEDVQELGHVAREVAREKFHEMRAQADGYVKAGTEKAKQWEKSFEDQIREHPLRSVAIAAGVGLVVGLLLRRH
jgi:ElaB/YqjD/DUF883 family membrane-anchored ribosome-binding protein